MTPERAKQFDLLIQRGAPISDIGRRLIPHEEFEIQQQGYIVLMEALMDNFREFFKDEGIDSQMGK